MMFKLKAKSAKRKIETQNLKFLVLNFSFTLFALNFALMLIYSFAFAQPISSTELINNAKQYAGKTVVYAGEVVGDVMVRGEYAWINVNDGNTAIGIWLNKNLTQNIIYTGSYKSKGDWLEITGIFQQSCPEHGGDLDIHALGLRKINSGRFLPERIILAKRNLVLVFLGVLCLVLILRQLKPASARK